jgi:hypothetical protein
MKKSLIFYLLAVMLITKIGFADVYKCVSEDGVVKFSDEPCGEDAELSFQTVSLNFDDVIGNASPYTDQPVAASKIDGNDFVAHARKIGKAILPYEYNNSYENQTTPMSPGWRIYLFFGPASNKKQYVIRMEYGRYPTSNGIYVWLNSISVKKDGKPFNPPAMSNVKKFKKMGTGRWEIRRE